MKRTCVVAMFALLVPALAAQEANGPKLDLGLDPVRAQIEASGDHLRTAAALFKAGQALMDHAAVLRAQEQDDAATEIDARAKKRLEHAVRQLTPLLEVPEPGFEALFQLGRCRELLFRLAERHDGLSASAAPAEYRRREQEVREPFLAITLRDVRSAGSRREAGQLGPWGLAAQAAIEHFRWMNANAGFDARAAIDAVTWPGAPAK